MGDNYLQSLIKGNQTLTQKVETLENQLKETIKMHNKEKIKNAILVNDIGKYKLQIKELKNRIEELESVEKNPLGTLVEMSRRFGL